MIPLRYLTPQDAAALAGTAPVPAEAGVIDLGDWDELLRAVQARLRLIANALDGQQGAVPALMHDQIMECADALDLFHRRVKQTARAQAFGPCASAPLGAAPVTLKWAAPFNEFSP